MFGSTQLQLPCNKTVVWGNFNLVHIVCEMAHQQVASHLQFVLLMCLCVQLLVLIKKFVVVMLIMMLYASIVGTCTREYLLSVSSRIVINYFRRPLFSAAAAWFRCEQDAYEQLIQASKASSWSSIVAKLNQEERDMLWAAIPAQLSSNISYTRGLPAPDLPATLGYWDAYLYFFHIAT